MTASPSQMAAAISPGSTQYGDRQGLEAGLGQAFGGAGGPAGSGPAGSGPASPPSMAPSGGDPLGQLLAGGIAPDGNPLTSGISVGPGPGAPQPTPFAGTEYERLRFLAERAKTPMLRHMARQALRRKVLRGG